MANSSSEIFFTCPVFVRKKPEVYYHTSIREVISKAQDQAGLWFSLVAVVDGVEESNQGFWSSQSSLWPESAIKSSIYYIFDLQR